MTLNEANEKFFTSVLISVGNTKLTGFWIIQVKRIYAPLLAILMMLSLTACNSASEDSGSVFAPPLIPTDESLTKLRDVNHNEMASNFLPDLKESALDISKYDTVFVGYPVWATDVPHAVISFLNKYDFSDKTVIPFCTHDGYGAGMLLLFIVHNILNIKWYGALFKGKYKPLRIFGTILNFAVLAAILMLGYSGIVMSRHLFSFLNIKTGMALARSMHLCVSYWGFVLMSLHLGVHWGIVVGKFRKLSKGKKRTAIVWSMRIIAVLIAVYGGYCFVKADIFSYMFLKNDFAFFDFEKSAVLVFAEYIAMMTLWTFFGYYIAKLLD